MVCLFVCLLVSLRDTLPFFLSLFSKTQANHWTKRMASTSSFVLVRSETFDFLR